MDPGLLSNVSSQRNCDNAVNSHGNKIVDICHTFNVIILNGRTKGDMIGNYTHLNNNGVSTVDYSLCNEHLYDSIENFIVLPLTVLSDHSKVVTIFKNGLPKPKIEADSYNWKPLKTKFKWDKEEKKKFENVLQNSTTEIDEISQRIEAGLIESSGVKLQ